MSNPTIMATKVNPGFSDQVIQLRSDYQQLRAATNLVARPIIDAQSVGGEKPSVIYWYDDGTEQGQCVRLYDIPGPLSGDILRLRRNLPSVSGHFQVDADAVRPLDIYLEPPEEPENDFEDVSDLIACLPLVEVDEQQHFLKKGKYRSEIHNLLACQGGSCPGRPLSPYLVHLVGRSDKNELVFKKWSPRYFVLPHFSDLATYKRWLLHMVDALKTLHSLGIIHRDLRVENLFARDGSRLVVCDLEGRWGRRAAPEIAREGLDAGWTAKSDVYDIGHCIECMVYANAPLTKQVEWPVPAPLDAIVEACMREIPEDRPTLEELRVMVEAIETDAK